MVITSLVDEKTVGQLSCTISSVTYPKTSRVDSEFLRGVKNSMVDPERC